MGGTVKQFLDALDDMRRIYPFDDDKTRISTRDVLRGDDRCLSIVTTDEETGIIIEMSKRLSVEGEYGYSIDTDCCRRA